MLFGPSGSGKSTILRALAGLTPGLQVSFERVDPQTAAWLSVSILRPHNRRLAYGPQHALLMPHYSVRENIRFPETLRGTPTNQSLVPALADLLELTPLLSKYPYPALGRRAATRVPGPRSDRA